MAGHAADDGIPAQLFAALARSEAYPGDPSARDGVRVVQTHLSWVFLTGARAYKVRKAVRLGFVDFGTRARRSADCLREVRLNRRLSPDVYLGVAPIHFARGKARIGRLAPDPEAAWLHRPEELCVVMRRLPEGRDARSLLARRRLRPEQLDAVADLLAEFHARHRLGTPVPMSPAAWRARCTGPVADNFTLLRESARAGLVPAALVERVARRAERFAREQRARFEARRRAGRGVDGHGDLHLEHVWFETDAAPPRLVDCLEFRDDLRRIDAASEVAFLAMDLRYRGHPALAARFLRRYAAATGDTDLYRVVDYYVSYRAAVRAKVACVAAADAALAPPQRAAARRSARRHLVLAERALAARGRGALVLVAGTVGSGKSSVARALADRMEAVVLASDVVRKQRARAAGAPVRYDERAKGAVYGELLARAEPVVASGRIALLDATFDTAARRRRARVWARARGVPAFLVEVRCPEAVARRRLAARAAAGADPSDAGPAQLAASLARWESPREWPARRRFAVDTAGAWRAGLRPVVLAVRAGAAADWYQ